MQEPEGLNDMIAALMSITRELAAWEAQATEAREGASAAARLTLDEEAQLARFRSMRAACETALRIADGKNLVARQDARTVTSQVDAWHELEKQLRGKQ